MPLIGLATMGAAADGLVRWYLRRTGGGRESGFILHRARRHAALMLGLVYLVPPVTLDPRIVVTVFVVALAIQGRGCTLQEVPSSSPIDQQLPRFSVPPTALTW